MDKLNFYYLQRVIESELDLVQTNTESALKLARQDLGILGVHSGGIGAQNAPPDLNVLVSGPGLATDPDGNRLYWATQQLVDCSQDYLGNPTTVVTPGNERWISVIAEYDQTLSSPVTDGNGSTVYTREFDSFNIYVSMATEQTIGTDSKPAIPSDGVLLFDIQLVNAQVQILNSDIDTARRQDLVHETGTNIATFEHGTLKSAIVELFGYVDILQTSAGVAFDIGSSDWHDGTSIAAVTVQNALREILDDLKANAGMDRIGGAAHTTAGGYADLAAGSAQDQIRSVADDIDGHIGGGGPNHPASAITNTAYSWISSTQLQNVIQEIVDDLANNTLAAGGALRVGFRETDNTPITTDAALRARLTLAISTTVTASHQFQDAQYFETLKGGTMKDGISRHTACGQSWWSNRSWAHPYSPGNTNTVGGNAYVGVACCVTPGDAKETCALALDNVHTSIVAISDTDPQLQTAHTVGSGSSTPTAICSDGSNFFVMFNDDTVYAYQFNGRIDPITPLWNSSLPAGASGTNDAIAIVDDTYLITGNSGISFGAGNMFTRLQRADGLGATSGDAGTAGSPYRYICSNGTEAYVCIDRTTFHEVYDIDIATMANAGIMGSFSQPGSDCTGLACDGEFIWYADDSNDPGEIHICPVGANAVAEASINRYRIGVAGNHAIGLVFDGLNVWVGGADGNVGGHAYKYAKAIPACAGDHVTATGTDLPGSKLIFTDPENSIGTAICFFATDGVSMWTTNAAGGDTIHRIPIVGLRA